jgi:hypothetical protein
MTHADMVLNWAARIDQIYAEMDPVWRSKDLSLSAGHQAGVVMGATRSLSRSLQKLAQYPSMEKEFKV